MSGKEIAKRISIVIVCVLAINGLMGQTRWTQTYLEGEDPFGESLIEHYDKGYLLAGRYGPNYPDYCWLIKTDVNGNEIWRKVIGDSEHYIVLSADINFNTAGDIFLTGSTNYYNENDYDPLIMKLNACGEKEWCLVITEEDNNFASGVLATDDGGCVVLLNMMSADRKKDRICLSKLDDSGNMLWKHCYNSSDTNLYHGDAYEIISCSDGGFLITGSCNYQDPAPPDLLWPKPYFIKTDSLGNFEWETVVYFDDTINGGRAWNTVVSSDLIYYYASLSHFKFNSGDDAPALLKMDLNGNVINIYDLAPPGDYGKMISAKFVTDTTLAASAVWGNGNQSSRAVIIDTLGKILEQTMPLDNDWMGLVEITFDQKILYFTNQNEGSDFDAYLFKYNQNLESDSIYPQYFTYDSLCNGEIVSDTIIQDDCGIIVGDWEIWMPREKNENKLDIYPNPASSKFTVRNLQSSFSSWHVEVFDLYGRKIKEFEMPKGQTEIEINVTGWKKGLYVVRVNNKDGLIGSSKVLVE